MNIWINLVTLIKLKLIIFNYKYLMGGSIGKKRSKIIIVGLDNSGKSTMINFLKPKKVRISSSQANLINPIP